MPSAQLGVNVVITDRTANFLDQASVALSEHMDDVGADIVLEIQRILRDAYNKPQKKGFSGLGGNRSIRTTGGIGDAIETGWSISADKAFVRIVWRDNGGATANSGEPFSKVYYLSKGTSPINVSSIDPSTASPNFLGYSAKSGNQTAINSLKSQAPMDYKKYGQSPKLWIEERGEFTESHTELGTFAQGIAEWMQWKGWIGDDPFSDVGDKSALYAMMNTIASIGAQPANPPFVRNNLLSGDLRSPTKKLIQSVNRVVEHYFKTGFTNQILRSIAPARETYKRSWGTQISYRDPSTGRFTKRPQ